MLAAMFFRFSPGVSYSINFYLITLLCCAVCAAEPLLGRLLRSPELDATDTHGAAGAAHGSAGVVNWYVVRPAIHAVLLLLFMAFDDRDTQFIYFQF